MLEGSPGVSTKQIPDRNPCKITGGNLKAAAGRFFDLTRGVILDETPKGTPDKATVVIPKNLLVEFPEKFMKGLLEELLNEFVKEVFEEFLLRNCQRNF